MELGSHDTISLHSFYASEIISKPEVDTILNHLECVLRFIIDHPDKLVDDVELIDDREMQLLLPPKLSMDVEVDQSPMKSRGFDLSSARNISELIELQVKKTPQRIAVSRMYLARCTHSDVFAAPVWTRRVLDVYTNELFSQ